MKKVLVVDDDPGVRAYLKAVLNNSGFEASEASNGLDAIQIQKEMLCDLIIADIFMPAADGLSTIQNFRKLYPDLKMIAMSGGGVFGTKDYLGYALLFGADVALEKPICRETLMDTVDNLMSSNCRLLQGCYF